MPRGGRLPDLPALARVIRSVGEPFTLRGVEATIDGRLERRRGRLALCVPSTGDVLDLAHLRHKVQWDPGLKREQPMTTDERSAYAHLADQAPRNGAAVRVVGPLVESKGSTVLTLEVRQFYFSCAASP